MSWASNSVSESLLRSLRAETRSDLRAIKDRIEAIRQRGDLAPAERELIETLAQHWEKYSAAANDTLDVGTTDAPMATMMLGGTDDDFQKVGASLETLSAFVDGQTTSIGLALAANAKDNQRILAFGGAAGILLSFLVTLLVSRSIVQPIRYVTRAMQHLSSEKFDLGATYMDRADEVGQMVRAIAAYRDNLQIQNLRFDAALNNMPHGLAMFDAEQCLVVANKRYAAMYGLSAADIKPGTPLRRILDVRVKNGVYARMTENDVRDRLTPSTTPVDPRRGVERRALDRGVAPADAERRLGDDARGHHRAAARRVAGRPHGDARRAHRPAQPADAARQPRARRSRG